MATLAIYSAAAERFYSGKYTKQERLPVEGALRC